MNPIRPRPAANIAYVLASETTGTKTGALRKSGSDYETALPSSPSMNSFPVLLKSIVPCPFGGDDTITVLNSSKEGRLEPGQYLLFDRILSPLQPSAGVVT
jgi:hypothetical protein